MRRKLRAKVEPGWRSFRKKTRLKLDVPEKLQGNFTDPVAAARTCPPPASSNVSVKAKLNHFCTFQS